ncbi:MAG: DUF58 domain-containing protein [Thermoplasmata archaeon]
MSSRSAPVSEIRWTARTVLLLVAGVVLILFAVTTRNPVPVFVGLPFLVAPVAAAMTGPGAPLRASLSWHSEGSETEVRVRGTLRAEPVGRTPDLHLVVERPGDLDGPLEPEIQCGPEGADFTFEWNAPRPTVSVIPSPLVVWQDPTGLVQRVAEGDRPELVVERSPPDLLRLGSVRLERTLPLPGETRSRRIGTSGEFFGIREAQPSDPPRLINWVATARAGRPLANEFELDRTGDVLVLLDTRPTPLGPTVDARLLGVSRAAAIGIADAFLREKDRVGYAAFGEFVDAVPLSSGRHQRARIQQAVLNTRRASVAGVPERCPITLGRYYPPGITVILLSSLVGESATDLVPHLRRRAYPVVVLSPSPLAVRSASFRMDPIDEALAARLEHLERENLLAETWVHAPVVDWDDFWSLANLVRFLRQPQRRRAG